MIPPLLIVAIQSTLGLAVYLLVFHYYVRGALRRSTAFVALAPLLLIHGFRMLGLTLLAPGQADAAQNFEALQTIAFGDLAAAVTGVIAAFAAFRKSSWTIPLAWLFTIVGVGDIVIVLYTVSTAGILDLGIGALWMTFGLLFPALIISHVYVIYVLIARRAELRASKL